MNPFIRISTLLLLVIFQAEVCAQTIKMAVFKLEPFMMRDPDTQEIVGATVDYWIEYLAPAMGVDIEVIGLLPIKRAQKMLETGQVDVVSQLTKIPEREALFLYPKTPLTKIISCLIVKKDSDIQEINEQHDLFGMNIGFITAGFIPPLLKHDKIRLDLISVLDFRHINHNKLMHGRVDAILDINCLSVKYYYKKRGYYDQVRFIKLPTSPIGVNSIFNNTKKGAELRGAFEEAHRKGIAENIFEKMSRKYLGDIGDPM